MKGVTNDDRVVALGLAAGVGTYEEKKDQVLEGVWVDISSVLTSLPFENLPAILQSSLSSSVQNAGFLAI